MYTLSIPRIARASAKLAERRGDPEDRRGILAVVTAAAKRRVQGLWSPIEEEVTAILSGYSQSDLRVIEDFLDRARSVQVKHAERIRALRKARSPKKPAGRRE
jgi:hypothetical protein